MCLAREELGSCSFGMPLTPHDLFRLNVNFDYCGVQAFLANNSLTVLAAFSTAATNASTTT
jgi:hypothetical protein